MSKEAIRDAILRLTPDVKQSSLNTFVSNLNSLYSKYHAPGEPIDLDWFIDYDTIEVAVADRPLSSQKNIFASILRLFPTNEYYKIRMNEIGDILKGELSKQTKTPKQEEGWKSPEDIKQIYNDMTYPRKLLSSRAQLTEAEKNSVVNYILFLLTSGLYIPPRRSLDWTEMRLNGEIDKTKDNYIEGDEFVFNTYKTAKKGQQRVPIPPELRRVIKAWAKKNDNPYLLFNTKGEQLSNVLIYQRLTSIYGSPTSTSMLRHIYLSNTYKDLPQLAEMRQLANNMGHSVETAMEYAKK